MKCSKCNNEIGYTEHYCSACGQISDIESIPIILEQDVYSAEHHPDNEEDNEKPIIKQKSRLVAGLLQLFFGGFGIGRFYLGYNGVAVGQLCTLFLCGIGYIWGVIDGILILCGEVDLDAEGISLKGSRKKNNDL